MSNSNGSIKRRVILKYRSLMKLWKCKKLPVYSNFGVWCRYYYFWLGTKDSYCLCGIKSNTSVQ